MPSERDTSTAAPVDLCEAWLGHDFCNRPEGHGGRHSYKAKPGDAQRDETRDAAKVYLVAETTWDHHAILSAWLKSEDAEEEARRLRREGSSYQYDVEELDLYA